MRLAWDRRDGAQTEAVFDRIAVEAGGIDLPLPFWQQPLDRWESATLLARSGRVIVPAAAARELGITDLDGRQPEPLSLETV